jgi:excisionase family DNA binding protein
MQALLDIRQASATLGLKPSTLYKMVCQRRLPFTKLGTRLLFSPERLAEWVAERSVEPLSGGEGKL